MAKRNLGRFPVQVSKQTEEETASLVALLKTQLEETTLGNEELLAAVDRLKIEEARYLLLPDIPLLYRDVCSSRLDCAERLLH